MLTFTEKVQFALGLLPAIIVRAQASSPLRCNLLAAVLIVARVLQELKISNPSCMS